MFTDLTPGLQESQGLKQKTLQELSQSFREFRFMGYQKWGNVG